MLFRSSPNSSLKVKESIDENQKEYYLREKLRAIKEELGDTPNKEDDADAIREELNNHPYPDYIKEKIEERETIYDEEFYDLFVVDKICTDCCYEWGCKEEKKIGTCEKCQLITKLRDKYVKSTREAKENDI